MSLLLYAIGFAGSPQAARPVSRLPPGVGGGPVRLIEAGDLAAAVSSMDASDVVPSVMRALAYAAVVEALHADRTVLPLRYGCVLDQDADVASLLRTRGGAYAEQLRGLNGCVEMGLGVFTAEHGSARTGNSDVTGAVEPRDVCGRVPGTAYLGRRRAFYAERERQAREADAWTERLREALTGTFVQCHAERSPARGPRPRVRVPPLTVHWLVKREQIPAFRAAVQRIDAVERVRLLLNGPWPPYNFATPDRLIV